MSMTVVRLTKRFESVGDTYGEPGLSMGNRKPPPPSPSHLASSTGSEEPAGALLSEAGPQSSFDLVAPRADVLMESLRATGYSLPDAVCDLIDNSNRRRGPKHLAELSLGRS